MSEKTITTRLRELRERLGVNQETIAEACDISRVALTRYENGQRVPRAEIAARLADFYGVTVDYLLGRESAPPPAQEKAPGDARAEAKRILEGMTDEQYQAALQYLKFLKAQK